MHTPSFRCDRTIVPAYPRTIRALARLVRIPASPEITEIETPRLGDLPGTHPTRRGPLQPGFWHLKNQAGTRRNAIPNRYAPPPSPTPIERARASALRRDRLISNSPEPGATHPILRKVTMKPAPFDYIAPTTLDEVIRALKAGDGEAKILAGGQSLMPMLNMRLARPTQLIDLAKISGLDSIREENGRIHIGAMTTKRTVERSSLVASRQPLLHEATRNIAHPQIRNRGTMGGSMAHADPRRRISGGRDRPRCRNASPWSHRRTDRCRLGFLYHLSDDGPRTRRSSRRSQLSRPPRRRWLVVPGVLTASWRFRHDGSRRHVRAQRQGKLRGRTHRALRRQSDSAAGNRCGSQFYAGKCPPKLSTKKSLRPLGKGSRTPYRIAMPPRNIGDALRAPAAAGVSMKPPREREVTEKRQHPVSLGRRNGLKGSQ